MGVSWKWMKMGGPKHPQTLHLGAGLDQSANHLRILWAIVQGSIIQSWIIQYHPASMMKLGMMAIVSSNCLRFWIFVGFLSRYHLPCICNSLELEPVILHGICYILAWSLCILHGICYIWPCSPSILHGICHILAFQPLICMVFATFWCFKRSCGSLEGSLGFHLGFHLKFHLGFHLGFYLGLHLGFHLGFHLRFLSGFI